MGCMTATHDPKQVVTMNEQSGLLTMGFARLNLLARENPSQQREGGGSGNKAPMHTRRRKKDYSVVICWPSGLFPIFFVFSFDKSAQDFKTFFSLSFGRKERASQS